MKQKRWRLSKYKFSLSYDEEGFWEETEDYKAYVQAGILARSVKREGRTFYMYSFTLLFWNLNVFWEE